MAHARRRSKLLHPMRWRWRLNSWSGNLCFQKIMGPLWFDLHQKKAVVSKTCGSSNNAFGQKIFLQRSQKNPLVGAMEQWEGCQNCSWRFTWSRLLAGFNPDFFVRFYLLVGYWLEIGSNQAWSKQHQVHKGQCISTMPFWHLSKKKVLSLYLKDSELEIE